MIGPKQPIWRSEKYRRFVASFPCFGCGLAGQSQAAHANAGKGLGLKTDDSKCFPLCSASPLRAGCHVEHDLCIEMTRDERRAQEVMYVARMQRIAKEHGWFGNKDAEMKTQTIVAIAVVASIPLLVNLTYEGTYAATEALLMAADRRPTATPAPATRPVQRPQPRPQPNTGGGSPKVVIL